MTEFGRDHFSFSTKVNVGEFYENRSGGENVSNSFSTTVFIISSPVSL